MDTMPLQPAIENESARMRRDILAPFEGMTVVGESRRVSNADALSTVGPLDRSKALGGERKRAKLFKKATK